MFKASTKQIIFERINAIETSIQLVSNIRSVEQILAKNILTINEKYALYSDLILMLDQLLLLPSQSFQSLIKQPLSSLQVVPPSLDQLPQLHLYSHRLRQLLKSIH